MLNVSITSSLYLTGLEASTVIWNQCFLRSDCRACMKRNIRMHTSQTFIDPGLQLDDMTRFGATRCLPLDLLGDHLHLSDAGTLPAHLFLDNRTTLTSLIVVATAVESSTMLESTQKDNPNVPHKRGRASTDHSSYTSALYTAYSVKIDYTDMVDSKRFTTAVMFSKEAEGKQE